MKTIIIGIAGPSGSGKTTVAKDLLAYYGEQNCTIISSDNYYKGLRGIPLTRIHEVNFDHPDSLDFELLAEHLLQLRSGLTVNIPSYDFSISSRRKETIKTVPTRVLNVRMNLISKLILQKPIPSSL